MGNSEFLKEMGITEWVSRDQPLATSAPVDQSMASEQKATAMTSAAEKMSQGSWLFFGSQPAGDTQVLFQNIIRVLGLASHEWSWKNTSDSLKQITAPENGLPVVAFAFGGVVAQKITGERDGLPQLRETILALKTGNEDEIPVIASYDLGQALSGPKEKVLLWQDLLLAKSVLQSI
jgi:DNA polymerase